MKKMKLLPMRLQFFADEGGSEALSDLGELNNLLDGMGSEPTIKVEEPAVEEPTPEPEPTLEEKQEPQSNKVDQKQYAFAELRTQNAQLLGVLGKLAKAHGIEYKDNNELLSKLSDDAVTKLAEKQNVPVELLQRMERLEQIEQLYQADQLKTQAFAGFQKVKDTYNLSEDELKTFAQELDQAGKNPFMQAIDLENEYRSRHLDDIVQKRVQAAVQEALARSNAADKHSTTPSQIVGAPDTGSTEKITTIAGLNNMLSELK